MSVVTPSSLVGARSPIYITAGYSALASSLTDVTLEVYIWNGSRSSRPADPAYTLFRDVFANTNVSFDIAPLVREYLSNAYDEFDIAAAQASQDGGVVWVQIDYEVNYLDKSATPATVNDTGSSSIFEANNGYALYTEAVNKTYGTGYLHNVKTRYIPERVNDVMYLYTGAYGGGYSNLTDVSVIPNVGSSNGFSITSLLTSLQPEGRVIGVPIGYNNLDLWMSSGAGGGGATPLNTAVTSYEIQLTATPFAVLDSVTINLVCESKYSVRTLRFINRFGVWDTLYFFKRSEESLSRSSEVYRGAVGSAGASGYVKDTTLPQYQEYSINGRLQTVCNTGFVEEDYKELIQDVLLSERLMLDDVPVRVVTNEVTMQKSINDKTINYTLTFEEAFDKRYV